MIRFSCPDIDATQGAIAHASERVGALCDELDNMILNDMLEDLTSLYNLSQRARAAMADLNTHRSVNLENVRTINSQLRDAIGD